MRSPRRPGYLSTVSENKAFLVTSAKLLRETDAGLALVSGADPSWWATGDLMSGLPSPEQVRAWWEDRDLPPEGAEHAEQGPNRSRTGSAGGESSRPSAEHVRQVFGEEPNSENGVGKPKTGGREEVLGVFGSSGDDPGMDF